MKVVGFKGTLTREFVKKHPDRAFLFGDNLVNQGTGIKAGQAVIRGEPNAYGIPTKKYPSMKEGSFFSDIEFKSQKEAIDKAFLKIPKNMTIVVPMDKNKNITLGAGRAQLSKRSPKTLLYIKEKLKELNKL
tara:strand:- start:43 stop:438 length:396 start_codon:yes stop_codon:yes gene_type:complete